MRVCHAALGSTSNFELPPEELEKFAKDHSLNGGAQSNSSTEDDEDDYTESLVYVSSPKVGPLLALVQGMTAEVQSLCVCLLCVQSG